MDAAVVAPVKGPDPATHRITFVTHIAAASTIGFVVFGAAGNRAISVNDRRAGAHTHGSTVSAP